jgi:hypothetical protein
MSSYRKSMSEAYNGMYLVEGNIDKIKDIVSKKSASKIDGVMVDMFTASAISQIYDKVNDANKKKMEKLPITKLAALAMKMMKNEYVPEEVDLDEGKVKYTRKLMKNKSIVDYVKKQQEKNRKKVAKFGNKKVGSFGNEPRFDSGYNWLDMASDEVKLSSMSLDKRKAFDAEAEYEAIARKLGIDKFEPKLEEVDLDEGSWHIAKNMNALKKKMQKPIPKGDLMVKFVMKHIGDDELTDEMFDAKTGTDMVPMIKSAMKRLNIKEEVDLDESGHTDVASAMNNVKVATSALTKMSGELSKLSPEDALPSWWTNKVAVAVDKLDGMADYLDTQVEEIELDELMPATKHVAKSKKNPDMFCVFDKDGNEVKLFKDKKDAEEYAIKNHDALNEEVELDEASARGDAKRSMSRDRDLSRKGSSLDKDDFATDDDVKAASKNIMMQLRKAANLRGTFAVEFGDKKKVKVDPKVAQAAASKYNSLRRPADKEKFQMQIAKSYKDMLGAIKEAVSPAQQAAIAISKKERGEKPKKESKFDTINKQLKGEK